MRTLLCILGVAAILTFALKLDQDAPPAAAGPSDVESVQDRAPAPRAPAREERVEADAEPTVETAPVVESIEELERRAVARERAPLPDPGRLVLRVIDGDAGVDLAEVTLRLRSADRFLERTTSSPIDLGLTAGAWEGTIRAAGYDVAVIDAVSVEAGVPRDLGVVVLRRGTAAVLGRVTSSAAAVTSFDVELYGAGRSPCPACDGEGRCATCGHADANTARAIGADGAFRFERLAAGPYRLVVRARESRHVARMVELRLEARERRRVDVDVVGEGLLHLELVDARGAPFDGHWPEGGSILAAPVRFYFGADGVPLATAEIESALAGVAHDAPVDFADMVEDAPPRRRADSGDDARADVRRRVFHSLWPPLYPEDFERVRLDAARSGAGRYRVRGLAPEADQVIASSGPFFSGVVELAEDRLDGARIKLQLFDRCAAQSDLVSTVTGASGQVACTACHSLPAKALFRR